MKEPWRIVRNAYLYTPETIQSFTYELGKKANAKIRIEIDPDSGHPGKGQGHYDLIFDDLVFE